jgi:hypothetical protein
MIKFLTSNAALRNRRKKGKGQQEGDEDGDGGEGGQKEEEDSRQKSSEKLRGLLPGIMNRWSNPTTPNAAGRSRKGGGQEEEKKQKEEEVCGFVLPQVEVAAGSSSSVEDTISK